MKSKIRFRIACILIMAICTGCSLFSFLHNAKDLLIHAILIGLLSFVTFWFIRELLQDLKREKNAVEINLESLLSQYFEYSNDLLCVADHKGYFKILNPEWEKVLGYTREELMKIPYISLVHPEDLESTMKAATDLVFQKKVLEFSNRYRCKNGSYRWLEWHSYPKDRFIFATVRDITEKKRIEDKLAQLNALHKAIFENAGFAIIITDVQGLITSVNRATEQMLGYAAGELIGLNVATTVHDMEELKIHSRMISKRMGRPVNPDFETIITDAYQDDPQEYEWTYIRKDRSRLPVLLKVTALHDKEGEISGFMGIAADLTQKKRDMDTISQNAKMIADERNMLHTLIDNIPDIIYVKDSESRFMLTNDFHAKILGKKVEDLLGRTDLDIHPEKLSAGFFNDERNLLETGIPIIGKEENILDTKGNIITFQTTKVPLRDSQGKIIGLVGNGHVITERKKAEEEVKKLNRELEKMVEERTERLHQVNKELESFAYTVSHDLRSPLRHVDGFMRMMYANIPTPSETVKTYADKINAVLKRMATMIDDLLAFSRLGRKELTPADVNLNTIIHHIFDYYSHETTSRDLTWNIYNLPIVKGDYNLLQLAFENLISNAIKYTSGKSNAVIEIGSTQIHGNFVEIYVKDNGIGFDMTYKNKLFGVFQRLHSNPQFEGTGIGLANAKQIITKHNGTIRAEGKVNEGAVFYVTLPV